MASIKQYKGKWRAQVQKHGVRASFMADTKREALAWAIRKESELDSVKVSKGKTFGAAARHYLATVSTEKRSEDWEKRRFNALIEHFGDETKLALITSERIGQWRDDRAKTVSGSTIKRDSNLLRHMFNLACDEWRWIDRNPFKGVRMPEHNPPRHQVWTWQLIKRVLRSNPPGDTGQAVRAFRIALHTGLRLAEVLQGVYEPSRRIIRLGMTKGSKVPVDVPVTKRAARVLAHTEKFTVSASDASSLFSKHCKKLLIEGLTFHDSRASALTWLSRRMDVMTLARISRHKDLRILQSVYYRETADQIAARI